MNLLSTAADLEEAGPEEEGLLAEVEIASAQPNHSKELVYADYQLHVDSFGEAFFLLCIRLLALEQQVSKKTGTQPDSRDLWPCRRHRLLAVPTRGNPVRATL